MASHKILIIEDDLIIATDLKATLEEAGHEVTGMARNLSEVLKFIKSDPPNLALVDITLGNIEDGGIQVAQEMLRHHWMPFIYLTAHSDISMMERAAATQPAAYLLKPFRNAELLIQIKLAYENFKHGSSDISRNSSPDVFYLPSKTGHERVSSTEVLFLKAQGHCTDIYIAGKKKPQMIGTNLGTLTRYFTTGNFMRLSKSLFINLDHLRQIERNHIYLGEENVKVEISEANRKDLMKTIKVIRTK